jgi:uncharacterized delta-60 repeat protein
MKFFTPILKTVLMFFISQFSILSYGQTNTFKVYTDLSHNNDYASSVAIQNDGKVLVAGDAWGKPCLLRYDLTGALDNSFGTEGKVFASFEGPQNPNKTELKIQKDGKIVMGTSYSNGIDADFVVLRFNMDGSPDLSFGNKGQAILPIGQANDYCNSIAIQSDGKIIAVGVTTIGSNGSGNYDFAAGRFNSDGTIDPTFGNEGKAITHIGQGNVANSVVIQPDGKIILAGKSNETIFSDFALVRYNQDGTLDKSFGNSGIVQTQVSGTYDFANSVGLQSDGKIIAGGTAQDGFSNYNFALVRYNSDGTLDETYGTNGIAVTDRSSVDIGNSLSLQSDEKLILAGGTYGELGYNFCVIRYNTDGTPDNSFGTDGLITTSFGYGDAEGNDVAIGTDGEIIIVGSYNHGEPNYNDFALVRLFSKLTVQTPPILSSPENSAYDLSVNPVMTWNEVSGATSYNVQVSPSLYFDDQVISCTGLPSNNFSVIGLSNNTTYYWRVSTTSVGGTSMWSDIWYFSTGVYNDLTERNTGQIKLYPVPVVNQLFIDGIQEKSATVSVLSAEGKLLKEIQGTGIREIDFADVQKGLYILRISGPDMNYSKKIMKL